MAKNDKLILTRLLTERRASIAASMTDAEYFEVFTSEQLLKDYDLSYDEIESGVVGGPGDGGIDSFYIFVNGDLVREDSDYSILLKDITIDLIITQSKTSEGFSETAIDKLISTTNSLLDFSKPLLGFKGAYNVGLLKTAQLFRETYERLAGKLPKLRISYHYASSGDIVDAKVRQKADSLKDVVRGHFSPVDVSFYFHTGGDLVELARQAPKSVHRLALSENPISAAKGAAFIGLTQIREFYKFITDEQEKLIPHIFEANVRDYLGQAGINEQIQKTLQNPDTEDFWWLNNGVTILATQVTLSGKILTIENPEIVNGLQTSREIYNYLSVAAPTNEERNLLIRVIVPSANESRYNIIKATNSQTVIAPASLRATDPIHRDIEDYLRTYDIYYDRRKNFYKNQGKPIKKIIGVPQLAQAVEAIVLQRPDTARARPSSLIKEEFDYQTLFSRDYPIQVYRASVEIIKSTETFLSKHSDNLTAVEKNDLKFYVAMIVSTNLVGTVSPTVEQIAALEGKIIEDGYLQRAYKLAKEQYARLGATDTVAKGPDMISSVKAELKQGRLF